MKIKNLKRQVRVFNLEHPTFVNKAGEHPVGKPETLTLLPLEAVEIHEDAALCAEIRAALRPLKGRPTLRVIG